MNKLIITGALFSMMLVFALLMPGAVQAQSYGCTYHSYEGCSGNYLYWYDSCGTQEDEIQYCSSGCYNNSCQNNYNGNCTSNYQEKCSGNGLYWYDSCGNQGALIQNCSNGCYNGICQNNNNYGNCTSNYQEKCLGNNLYWYDSCGNQQNLVQYCPNGCYNNSCQNNNNYNYNNYGNCTYHSYEKCSGNGLYWYDSCGNQQDLVQYCSNGCSGNSCGYNNYNNNNYYSYGSCAYHAYKLCSGNNIYWYDSCGDQQDLYYSCGGGQVCQYGQCTTYVAPILPVVVQPANNYVSHYKTACYDSSIYWYDSLGAQTGLDKNCSDGNSCTLDTCSGDKCLNTLKCDGSTCAVGSADYNTYCSTAQGAPTQPATTNNQNTSTNTNMGALSILFFSKQNSTDTQWQKTAQVGSNGQVYFMITVTNNSATQIDNVNISANIPSEVSSLGNLQLNGVPVSGDIVSGINIGSISPSSTKPITFEGKTQAISAASTKQAIATSNVSGATQSDTISLSFNPNQATAAVSSAPATNGFWEFIKRWYLWILVIVVLIFLFVIVFRRLSSEA